MKYLLDTLTFLLWISDTSKLTSRVVEVINSPTNSIFLSISSVREIQVKSQLGRLDLPAPILDIITHQNQENGITILPISLEHIVAMTRLPIYHNDIFDHLLITQAMVESLVILTKDPLVTRYPVKTLW